MAKCLRCALGVEQQFKRRGHASVSRTLNFLIDRSAKRMDAKTLLIAVLLAGVGVLGFLYYESQQSSVKIDLPGVKIEGK